jgi:HSP20 family molecular chaperone IbpA
VDPDKVAAAYAKGVVTVAIPKKPAAVPKKIAVKAE